MPLFPSLLQHPSGVGRVIAFALLFVVAAACSTSSLAATPSTASPQATTTPHRAQQESTPSPTSSPTGAPSAVFLTLLAPREGAGLSVPTVRLLGQTRADAVLSINGELADVDYDGTFRHDLSLEPGANLIELTASGLDGDSAYQSAAVFYITDGSSVPLDLLYPWDGLQVQDPNLIVLGSTRPDAIVGVNGTPVEVGPLGIFETTIVLEEGPNVIEIVATDMDGDINYQTVGVVYIP